METVNEILLIIPTKNEAPSIGAVLKAVPQKVENVPVKTLVIDARSTDGTDRIVEEEHVRMVPQLSRGGKGAAMIEASAMTTSEIICFVDGDDTYPVEDLPRLVRPILEGKADMVVGSRILGKREHGSISAANLIGNKLFNSMTNFALKSQITDMLSGFRAIRRESFERLFLSTSSFEIEAEITIEALAKDLRIVEIPINYRRRTGNPTKLDPIRDGYTILKVLVLVLLDTRPFLFFGIASGIVFIIGIYPAALVISEKLSTGTIQHLPSAIFASMLWVLSAIVFVFGVISQLIVISRRRIEDLILRQATRMKERCS